MLLFYRLKQRAWLLLLLGCFLYMFYHLLSGDLGLLKLNYWTQTRAVLLRELRILEAEKSRLQKRNALLRSPFDQDFLEEQSKEILGWAGEAELVYRHANFAFD